MKKILTAILICIIFTFPAFSRLLEAALKDGIGVRPLGMGGAFTALADDSSAVFYNPAGIQRTRTEYIHGYMDVNNTLYKAGAYTVASIRNFKFANWYVEDMNSGRVEVTAISYTAPTKGIQFGLTMKNVHGATSTETVSGYSFDVGLKGKLAGIVFGINFQDLSREDLNIPASVRAGTLIDFGTSKLIIEGEGRNLSDNSISRIYPHVGFETRLTRGLVGRVGYDKDYYTSGFTLAIPMFDVEYAIAVNKEDTAQSSVQRIGFKLARR